MPEAGEVMLILPMLLERLLNVGLGLGWLLLLLVMLS